MELTLHEAACLLYLEEVSVDYGGTFDASALCAGFDEIIQRWHGIGFIQTGLIGDKNGKPRPKTANGRRMTHWVTLSEAAWLRAHNERRARSISTRRFTQVVRLGAPVEFAAAT